MARQDRPGRPADLLAFADDLDSLCRHALEATGRELPPEHAVVILLRQVAEKDADVDVPGGSVVPSRRLAVVGR